jgi:hypothetical protein
MSDELDVVVGQIREFAAEVLPVHDDGKEPCPECGKRYVPGPGMGVHRHSAHGWAGEKKKRTPRRPASNGAPGPGRPRKIDLTVDDVFDAVVNQMFPRGSIPVAALTPLLRWRHATDEMLIEVLHGGSE